ncbi:cytochrome c oxidase assembly factor CtaG [Edaphobacillus lindanitolerans]|uniref:cytochrome c oxidase assembly factor CtaG n=1 Tax=Edaphobacillus lindanitolerans TaxID=550447 RepID=UPI000976AB77|nr:cytochrome c oxidase assembly factor CtaG [Edaphobacillus lindanitolerans]
MPISIFGFVALWSPYFFASLVALFLLYLLITVKWRDRFSGSEPLKRSELISFSVGMILVYATKGSPVDLLGHILFTMHMVQMAILLLVAAPFLIMGIPGWIWKKVFSVPVLGSVLRVMTKPVISLLLFSAMFSVYHLPLILDTIKLSLPLHAVFTITLFISALFLWWPIVNTIGVTAKLQGLHKVAYIIASAILITPACALIIFVDTPVYATYQSGESWLQAMALCVPASTLGTLASAGLSGPEVFTKMPILYDQQLGGVIMKVLQEIIYGVVLGRIFINWFRHERDNADELTKKQLLERERLSMYS